MSRAKMQRLLRRGDVFYFRAAVPTEWRRAINCTEIELTLETTDRAVATIRCRHMSNAFDLFFGRSALLSKPSMQQLEAAIRAYFQGELNNALLISHDLPDDPALDLDAEIEGLREDIARLTGELKTKTFDLLTLAEAAEIVQAQVAGEKVAPLDRAAMKAFLKRDAATGSRISKNVASRDRVASQQPCDEAVAPMPCKITLHVCRARKTDVADTAIYVNVVEYDIAAAAPAIDLSGRCRKRRIVSSGGFEMQGMMLADEALGYLCDKYSFQTVLDVGSGQGLHAEAFRQRGKAVIEMDTSPHWGGSMDVSADFVTWTAEEPFDLVWCSHVLEHQPNVGLFLQSAYNALKPGGILAITVPPLKTDIVGGHLTIWNAGLLMYNLVIAGFDCRSARLKKYGYNISIIVRKCRAQLPPLRMDSGDIETLSAFFPIPVEQGFNGEIENIQWTDEPNIHPPAGPIIDSTKINIDQFQALRPATDDLANLLWSASCLSIDGPIAEFGVFQARSLRALALHHHHRQIYGFDSFRGLPEPWVRSETSTYETGHFATALPQDLPANVKLVPGFFSETLPAWRQTLEGPLALIHIDADLYSSAKEVLFGLNDRIVAGTVLVFDELCDWRNSGIYPAWPEGEWKALLEWMSARNRTVRILSRGPDFSATVVVSR